MPSGPLLKHRYTGIGAATAKIAMAALASNPSTIGLTTGIAGKVVNFLLTRLFTMLASLGLVVLNVGAAKVETLIDGGNYDGTWDSAEKLIGAIRDTGRELTKAEEKAIDDPVISAFRKFASFAREKNKK